MLSVGRLILILQAILAMLSLLFLNFLQITSISTLKQHIKLKANIPFSKLSSPKLQEVSSSIHKFIDKCEKSVRKINHKNTLGFQRR